jgi:hypothetical protein
MLKSLYMLRCLPGWVQDNVSAVRDEAAPYREMTPERRRQALHSACRAAVHQLASRADRERILAYRDPLPASSVAALRRLREQTRKT